MPKTNNLFITHPELVKGWHPTKNLPLMPHQVTFGSNKNIWWVCNNKHEWQTRVQNRRGGKIGCPYCSGRLVTPETSLANKRPELIAEWHFEKNAKITPYDVKYGSQKKYWWQCSKDEHHEWEASPLVRMYGGGCPYCAKRNSRLTLKNSLAALYPELAKEWHPTRNQSLTPEDVKATSVTKAWWICINKHEWPAKILEKVGSQSRKGTGCPHCYRQASDAEYRLAAELKKIFPSLETRKKIKGKEADIFIPELKLVIEIDGFHYHNGEVPLKRDLNKNMLFNSEGLEVIRFRGGNLKKLSKNDIHFDCKSIKIIDIKELLSIVEKEYATQLAEAQKSLIKTYYDKENYWNEGAYQEEKTMLPGKRNSVNLKDVRPDLAAQWHPTKNGTRLPEQYSYKSGQKAFWICEVKSHEWADKISTRSNGGGCPYCSGKRACDDNCLATINPSLAKEWHPTKNLPLTAKDVVPGSNKKVWWQCLKQKTHEWVATIDSRHGRKSGCPYCSNKRIDKDNCLPATHPSLQLNGTSSRMIPCRPSK